MLRTIRGQAPIKVPWQPCPHLQSSRGVDVRAYEREDATTIGWLNATPQPRQVGHLQIDRRNPGHFGQVAQDLSGPTYDLAPIHEQFHSFVLYHPIRAFGWPT